MLRNPVPTDVLPSRKRRVDVTGRAVPRVVLLPDVPSGSSRRSGRLATGRPSPSLEWNDNCCTVDQSIVHNYLLASLASLPPLPPCLLASLVDLPVRQERHPSRAAHRDRHHVMGLGVLGGKKKKKIITQEKIRDRRRAVVRCGRISSKHAPPGQIREARKAASCQGFQGVVEPGPDGSVGQRNFKTRASCLRCTYAPLRDTVMTVMTVVWPFRSRPSLRRPPLLRTLRRGVRIFMEPLRPATSGRSGKLGLVTCRHQFLAVLASVPSPRKLSWARKGEISRFLLAFGREGGSCVSRVRSN